MPIYEYQCENCGHKMEAFQRISDDPLKECPKCHEEALRKLVSAAAFKLKGTGWYETDFKDNKGQAKNDKKSSSNNKKTDTAKSDPGKDTKSDSKTSEKKTSDSSKKETSKTD